MKSLENGTPLATGKSSTVIRLIDYTTASLPMKMLDKPDKHMVRMIMELIRNRSFTLTTGDSKPSRLRRLRNGVPQGSVLAPLLFNIYTYDIPSITSKKFAYADDLAILYTSGEWKELERTLSQDMTTLSEYLQTWRLKLSHTKR